MSNQRITFKLLLAGAMLLVSAAGVPAQALAKTYKVDCTGRGNLQRTIDSAKSGDEIVVTGICRENVRIADKALTLRGDESAAGPHGITGVTEATDAVGIHNSRGTHIEGLTIDNPHYTGVRIEHFSYVSMTDCTIEDSWMGAASAIIVNKVSEFTGLRLQLNRNLRGLGAWAQSEAMCFECDLDGNGWGAVSAQNSWVTLLDSVVAGLRGIAAYGHSYIDIDCGTYVSPHDCSLSGTSMAGRAQEHSKVAFYEAGDFEGPIYVTGKSEAWLLGARQQAIGWKNTVDEGSSMKVEPGVTGNSKLLGTTDVAGFSHVLVINGGTVLDGHMNCVSGGDAFIDMGNDLTGFTASGCAHIP